MITLDTFYQEMKQDNRDLNAKIDKIHESIDSLCERTTAIETEKKVKDKNKQDKFNIITVCLGLLGGTATVLGIINALKL